MKIRLHMTFTLLAALCGIGLGLQGCDGDGGPACGDTMCAASEVCCNPLAGICTPPDGFCAQ
jgi:hypothetical protein